VLAINGGQLNTVIKSSEHNYKLLPEHKQDFRMVALSLCIQLLFSEIKSEGLLGYALLKKTIV